MLMFSLNLWPVERVNLDKPKYGDWDLKPKKIWTIEGAGNDVFSMPDVLVSDEGTLFIYDWKNKRSYLFDKYGQFVKIYSKRGEGPGEIRFYMKGLLIKDKHIIVDFDRLHYFSKAGNYLHSIPNIFTEREPQFFIDEQQFFSAPSHDISTRPGNIQFNHLGTKAKNVVKTLDPLNAKEVRETPSINIIGLTPQIIIGYDPIGQNIYYGTNNLYLIHRMDLEGKASLSFSIQRQQESVSDDRIRAEADLFGGEPINPRQMKSLSKKTTYFHRLQIIDGLIYVFNGNFGLHWEKQQIDVFSLKGEYLYKIVFIPEEGEKIYFSRSNILIKKSHLYTVLEDEGGEVKIIKYEITLPRN
jgi:hypothetical protein